MNKSLIFILTILLFLTACSSQQGDKKTAIVKTETTYKFEPKNYEESLFDTVLDTDKSLRLTIKRYTLMNKGFEVPFKYDENITEIIHFRDFAADIKILFGEKIIYSETIQKEIFSDKIPDDDFIASSFLSLVSLDNFDKTTGLTNIKCMIVMIESDYAYFFNLSIDKDGKTTINLNEEI